MKKALHLLFLLVMLLFGQTAMAEDYTFQEGENTLKENTSVKGTYTVKQTGKIIIETQHQNFSITCGSTTASEKTVYTDGGYNTRYDITANAGDVLNISTPFSYGNKLRITELGEGPIQIKVVAVTPKNGGIFSWNSSGMVTVQFNTPVTATGATLTYDGKSYSVDDFRVNSQFVSFNITNALDQAYSAGLTQGKAITIKITGITDLYDNTNKYAGSGNYTFPYKAPYQQGTMTSSTVNGQSIEVGMNDGYNFMSFYNPANNDGVFTFEFSNNVQSVEKVTVTMGNLDQSTTGKYYYEEMDDVKIQGNKIIVDARGKLRSLARMFPTVNMADETTDTEDRGYVDYSHINLALSNVQDVNGNFMRSPGQGTVGSYSYSFNYEEIVDDIAMDGANCAEGDNIKAGTRVELWISEQVQSFDGVKINIKVDNGQAPDEEGNPVYATGTINVPAGAIEVLESDPSVGTVIAFTIPELKAVVMEDGGAEEPVEKEYPAVDGQNYIVYLQVTTTNGLPHDLKIEFMNASTSAIQDINAQSAAKSSTAYNIAGQRINGNAKGIIIVDGKKMVK